MQKLFGGLILAAAIVLGAVWFVHWSKTRALNSGEVHVRQPPAENVKPPTPGSATPTHPAAPQEVASNDPADSSRGQSQVGVANDPAADTISRNPPNGVVIAGSGKFEVYRQGDITFRLNTETGQVCVLLATDAQWRKPLVYDHGCGTH